MTRRETDTHLREHDKDLLLAMLKYHLSPDMRRIIMTELPRAYNAWMGHDVVQVTRRSDGSTL